jgi:hypothetical protein
MTAGFFVPAVIATKQSSLGLWGYCAVRFALAFLTAKYAPRKLMSATTMVTASNM